MDHPATLSVENESEFVEARDELERRIRAGSLLEVEELRDQYPAVWENTETALELVYSEYVLRVANGESPDRRDWYRRYPEWRERLERLFGLHDLLSDHDTHRGLHDATIPRIKPLEPLETDVHPEGYELHEELGRGGMAVVYRAKQRELNRIVALKVLRGGAWFADADAIRIRREAEAAARMQHANIVQIYQIGDWDGVPFLCLEYVGGGTLGEFLARNQRQGTLGITPKQAAELVATLARAMQYAHDNGIIHRDLKPANVLLSANVATPLAEPKITDFGLAVTADMSLSLTQTATLAGTPCYMAPEQAEPRRNGVGPRTDVYALGGILYELLTGRPAFQGASVLETLDFVRSAEPIQPRILQRQVPLDLETICLKCLQKSADRRYASAGELADDLERFQSGQAIHARPVSWFETIRKTVKRHPLVSGLVGSVMVMTALSMGLLYGLYHNSEQARLQEHALREQLEETRSKELIASANAHWLNGDTLEAKKLLASCAEPYRNEELAALQKIVNTEESTATGTATGAILASPGGKYVLIEQGYSARLPGVHPALDTRVTRPPEIIDRQTGTKIGEVKSVSRSFLYQYHFSDTEDKLYAVRTSNNSVYNSIVKGTPGYSEPPHVIVFDLHTRTETKLAIKTPDRGTAWKLRHFLVAIHDSKAKTIAIRNLFEERLMSSITLPDLSPCKRLIFCTANNNLISIHDDRLYWWDTNTGKSIRSLPFKYQSTQSRFIDNPEGNLLYYCEQQALRFPETLDRIIAWNTKTNREEFRIESPDVFHSYRVDPSGQFLAMSMDRQIRIYDARTGRFRIALRGHKTGTPNIDFLPNHKLASVSTDTQLKTWNLSAWVE
jgi:serine/threonine protein kinase